MGRACFSVCWATLRREEGGIVYIQVSLPWGSRGKSQPQSKRHGGVSDPGPSWSDATPGPSVLQSPANYTHR